MSPMMSGSRKAETICWNDAGGSLSVGHYELCRDDISGISLEAPIISDLRENANTIG